MSKQKYRRKTVAIGLLLVLLIGSSYIIYGNIKMKNIFHSDKTPYVLISNLPNPTREMIIYNRNSLIDAVSDNRLNFVDSFSVDEDSELSNFIRNDNSFRQVEYSNSTTSVTKIQVEKELDIIRCFYKYNYPAYTFYSMEKDFDVSISTILSTFTEDNMDSLEYSQLLQETFLPILSDDHARIDGNNYRDLFLPVKTTYVSSISFEYDGAFFTYFGDKKYRLADSLYLVHSVVGKAGLIEYRLVDTPTTMLDNIFFSEEIIFVSDNNENEVFTVDFLPLNSVVEQIEFSTTQSEYSEYSTLETDSFTYIRNTGLTDKSSANAMIADAKNIDQNKPIVLDLRGNHGGNSGYITSWILELKSVPQIQGKNIFYDNPTSMYTVISMTSNSAIGKRINANIVPHIKQNTIPFYNMHIKNDIPIYVLIDQQVKSSGEWWVSYIRRMDNVVIVGENTSGTQIGGNTVFINLPYSGVRVSSSTITNFDNDFSSYEFKGLSPDIYCNSEYALDFVLKLIDIDCQS